MKRLHWLAILMTITILAITGFQSYWLKQTYDREKKSLNFNTEVAFVTTVRNLQGSKLKLGKIFSDSTFERKRIFFNENNPDSFGFSEESPNGNIVATINVLQDKIKDSLKGNNLKVSKGTIVELNKTNVYYKKDSSNLSGKFRRDLVGAKNSEVMLRFLSGVDSLQDTLSVKEITITYAEALKKQKMQVPFTVVRLDSAEKHFNEPGSNAVTIGFFHPVTYKLKLGNTFPYLLKQIASPILFSIFLVGVTILSFLLLYRSLLRQHKLAQLKNDFISNITHELKTPIATVGVAIEALRNFNALQDPQRTKEYLDISSNELQRLSLLVDKVLKLSMFEKKEIELKYEMMNLKEVVDEVVSSMRLQLEKYHAHCSITADGDLNLQGDRLHLLSVVFNLLDNALKYSKSNPSIKVNIQGNADNIILSVTDNGIGIPPEYKDKLFEKFFRVPAGDTHNAKGYGLGLSYVAHVVQQHKGSIAVESQPRMGSKFIITLPKHQSKT